MSTETSIPLTPEEQRRSRKRRRRTVLLVVFLFLSGLGVYYLNQATVWTYERFVRPTKQKLMENGYPGRPMDRTNPPAVPGAFGFGSVEFPLPGEPTLTCLDEDGVRVMAGGVKLWVRHRQLPLFFPVKKDKPLLRFAGSLVRLYPFNRHAPDIARKVTHNGPVEFPMYTPVDNLLKLYGSIGYVILTPGASGGADDSYFASVEGPGMFTLVQGHERSEHSAIMLILTVREDRLEEHMMAVVTQERDYHDAYDAILRDLRITDAPREPMAGLDECPPKSN